ncbi:uncharacterized protein LOC122073899 [Macadamia integrifolia]|uniref:uncharacterized protein LOC122073899 n=1 Tax=Macadamia integrifolia TaxID=60698 RepID=UPI001C4EEB5D|nr:uncharacterized protein LOC122073899 [Macadamia integrifolia]
MMSKAGDEEEEEECFYESLDRILSSSSTSSSTSGAISEDDDSNYASELPPVPRFPMAISNYDVWIAEPSSIEERRKRLLREMGLARDPSLSRTRLKNSLSSSDDHATTTTITAQPCGKEVELGRSASADQLLSPQKQVQQPFDTSNSAISRSKSDGGAANCPSSLCRSTLGHCNSSTPSTSADSIHSIQSVGESCLPLQSVGESCLPSVHNNPHHHLLSKSRSNGSNGSPTANVASSPNKPPTGRPSRRVEEIGTNSSPAVLANPGGGEFGDDTDAPGIVSVPDQVCTIKNLDNGKEFVVNEVREDGMCNKLREVGTGRQLTMEEFEMCVGHSPIVQELMRRQNVEALNGKKDDQDPNVNGSVGSGSKVKKKGGWFKSIKNVASTVTGNWERRSSDERDTSSDKGGRRSSSATDDSQDVSFHGPERVRVRQYGKSCKELSALYKSQEIQAHNGSIWTIKFSLDGRYLASAGEDCIIHVWQVVEAERKGDLLMEKLEDGILNPYFMANGSPEPTSLQSIDNNYEKKRRARTSTGRKSVNLDHILVPETVFALSEKPICSFSGHLDDVLDLSWSKSQYLLSSSMDKTVRLWHMSSSTCLKIFSHSDYVTCIKFNPVDDRYFISGSLDAKVRIWSIPDRQVVDWNDLHEMVTAACYTPDGQGALVGSYKGTCRLYNTTENKLQQKGQIDLKNKKKKSHLKKITGFQFAPGSSSEVLITSADSRIRVIEDIDMVHKFKGFRNTSSQISASLTANGKYVVCASEDSHVYVWKHEGDSRPSRSKGVTATRSYEHFHCQDVSVAIPWPGIGCIGEIQDSFRRELNGLSSCRDSFSSANCLSFPVEEAGDEGSPATYGCPNSPLDGPISSSNNSFFADKISATWPEEKLLAATRNQSPCGSMDLSKGVLQGRSAWGMAIVTAGLRGELRTFQNFGLPVRI